MINSRLMYILQDKNQLRLAVAIELIDEILAQAIYVEKLNQKICIYGNAGDPKLYVGREVMGREEELYSHDLIKIKDFSVTNEEKHQYDYLNFGSLIEWAESSLTNKGKSWFRIQIDLDEFQIAEVTFFDNMDKYIGSACA